GAQNKGQRRRQGKAQPGRQRTRMTGAGQAQGNAHLTAGRAGQKLAQGDQVCITALGKPATADYELVTEITQVGDGPTKGGQPRAQEDKEYRPGPAVQGRTGRLLH